MSMLSAQIDELRKAAEYYDDSEVASIMRYAADTIWELRESVHREREEADKLRELLKAAYRCTNAGPSCLECRIVAGGCTLLSAMRELGVD